MSRRALIPCLGVLFCLLSAPVAPDARGADWTLQVDPLTTALGFVHIQVEYAIDDHWSVYAGPSLRLFNGLLAEDGDVDFTGLGGEVGLRWFFNGGAPAGWWAQVRGVLAHLSVDDAAATGAGGYVSLVAGHTWIIDGWFVLAAGLGVQYLDYEIAGSGPKGILPAAHTTIGVAL
jgi:hypothetical protein